MWIFFKIYLRGREGGEITYGRQTLHHWGFMFEKGEKRKKTKHSQTLLNADFIYMVSKQPECPPRGVVECGTTQQLPQSHPDFTSPHHLLPLAPAFRTVVVVLYKLYLVFSYGILYLNYRARENYSTGNCMS